MIPCTPAQRQQIHVELHRRNLLHRKSEIIDAVTNGRCDSSTGLSYEEAEALIKDLRNRYYDQQAEKNPNSKLMAKLFAMAHEMGWITKSVQADNNGQLKTVKDYSRVHSWVNKYGYLRKSLREYTYKELPKLVSQFENYPYREYLNRFSS